MEQDIRTERSFGVTGELKPVQRRNMLNLINSEIYPDLLDLMEMVCIEVETVLINTDADDEKAVLANHKMAKVAWQMFTHMQEKIITEANSYLRSVERKPPMPELTREEQRRENLLNPILPAPEEEDELMGA